MRLWIEDDNGNKVKCEEIKTVNVPNSILVFEADRLMTKSYMDNFHAYIKAQTGHESVLLNGGIRLVAEVSPGELCGK